MKAVKQWADVTTCHGVRDVTKCSSYSGKCCWSLVVFAFVIVMSLSLADTYRTFAQHHWVTAVYEESTSGMNGFPTITVCSYNRLRHSAVVQYNLSEDNLIYLLHKMPPEKMFSGDVRLNDSSREAFVQWKIDHNMTTKQIFEELSPRCEDTFEFIGHNTLAANNCSSSDFLKITPVFTAEFGQCYQLNVRFPNKINYPGKKYALNLLLNAHLKDYLNFSVGNYLDQGFALQFQYGPKVVEWQWISVAPGYHFMIGLRERQNRVKPTSPQSFGNIWEVLFSQPLTSKPPCAKSPKLKYLDREHYSREHCLVECIAQPIVENCGCISFSDSPYVPMCEAEEYVSCLELLKQMNITWNDEACAQTCEEPCFDRRIEATMSFTSFPSDNQLESLQNLLRAGKQEMTFEEIWEDYAAIDIFFEKLSVLVVEQYESFGLEDLVSSNGGVMSLWTGVSLLTIVQALVYIVYGFACGVGSIKRKLFALKDGETQTAQKATEDAKPAKPLGNDRISVINIVRRKIIRSERLKSSTNA